MSNKDQWGDRKKNWKGFPLNWETYQDYERELSEVKLLTPFQVAILLGAVRVYAWPTRWENLSIERDELEKIISEIEDRLMRNEEAMTIDYDAWKQASKEAIYEAVNDIAKQIVSGRTTNIAVGEDGTVTDPTTDDPTTEVPPDDPDTPTIREDFASRAGGAIRVADGLQKILTDLSTWYGSGTVTEQQAVDRLVLLYGFVEADAQILVNYYYTVYMNATGVISVAGTPLSQNFFCKGISIASLADYIYRLHATAGEVPTLEVFAERLPDGILNRLFDEGAQIPSQDYTQYTCVPIDPETLTLDMSTANTVTRQFNQNAKANHRFRIRASGQFTDSDEPNVVRDFLYSFNTLTGVKTFENPNSITGSGFVAISASQVPYNPSGVYDYIVQKSGSANTFSATRDNGSFTTPNVTGIITVEMEDLGEYTA